MQYYFKKISTALTSLSERERTDMRLHLAAFIDEHPARVPLRIRISTAMVSILNAHPPASFLGATLALMLVIGVGTSYAAQTALPGNFLYDVKLAVDEPIERATVASSETQTQWDLTLANRRLEEAEELAASGNLDPGTATIVSTQIAADTQNYDASVAAIATSSDSAAVVADAQSDLEAALSAHVQILAAIASSSATSADQVAPVLAIVRSHMSSAVAAHIAALASLHADMTATTTTATSTDATSATIHTATQIAATAKAPDTVSALPATPALARRALMSIFSSFSNSDAASSTATASSTDTATSTDDAF